MIDADGCRESTDLTDLLRSVKDSFDLMVKPRELISLEIVPGGHSPSFPGSRRPPAVYRPCVPFSVIAPSQ